MLRLTAHTHTRARTCTPWTRAFSFNACVYAPKRGPTPSTEGTGAARARRQKTRASLSSDERRTKRSSSASSATNLERLTAPKASATSSFKASSAQTRADKQPTTSPLASAAPPPMRGRFNRVATNKGLSFATYLYVLGEGTTLGLTCLLHLNLLGIGDAGLWLGFLGVPVDRYLNVGPTVFGLQLSPRLLLNYLMANACCYPLYRLQYTFCEKTAPLFTAVWRPVRQAVRARKEQSNTIPKAPSPKQ